MEKIFAFFSSCSSSGKPVRCWRKKNESDKPEREREMVKDDEKYQWKKKFMRVRKRHIERTKKRDIVEEINLY